MESRGDAMAHGPNECEGCGVNHMPAGLHYETDGTPRTDWMLEPQWRLVEFVGVDGQGRALYVEIEEE
jgi:hypothetical protein